MKRILKYAAILCLGLGLCSCDKLFDGLEGDLSKMTEEDMISTVAGLERLLANSYYYIPMNAFGSSDKNTMDATDTQATTYSITVSSFFNYTQVRSVNQVILQIDEAFANGVIGQEERDEMMGEALFIRAYMYFGSVKAFGGVPIVTEPLDDLYDGGENAGLYVPRSTEKETWDFVISELDKAIELLPESRTDGSYRATKWAALGLQSRVALYAASVSKFWTNAALASTYQAVAAKKTYMEESYAAEYYKKCIESSEELINSGVFSLYGGATTDRDAAVQNLYTLFTARQDCEFIFGKSYETGVSTASNGFDFSNSPQQAHASGTSSWQWGRYSVTSDIVDAFDDYADDGSRVDGTVKTRESGNETQISTNISQPTSSFRVTDDYIRYDATSDPFENKDARFKAWVIYPGCNFRSTDIVIQGGFVKADGSATFYQHAETVKDGVTYYSLGASNINYCSAFYKLDDSNAGNWYSTGFGIKKYLLPSAVVYSTNPWYDIRYAEILLNYAEAVVESGLGDATLAKKCLNDIRHRAAFTDDIELTSENVQHERRIELCFENDRNHTLHRRREYVNNAGGVQHRKHALVPTLDLTGDSPKYIFVRTNVFRNDINMLPAGLTTDIVDYYGEISNYAKNRYEPNPSQE